MGATTDEETPDGQRAQRSNGHRLPDVSRLSTAARISEVRTLRPRDVHRDGLVLPNLKNPTRVVKTAHLSAAYLESVAGIKMVYIPYRGLGPAMNDIVAGHVDMMFDTLTTSLPLHREGRIRMVAVASSCRSRSSAGWMRATSSITSPGSISLGMLAPAFLKRRSTRLLKFSANNPFS